MSDVADKIALITGASRGLGAALAEDLGARGWHIVAVARTTGALEEVDDRVRAGGGRTTLAPMDICLADAMGQLVQAIAGRWGGLDLWAHTAIQAPPLAPAGHVDAGDWTKALATNATALAGLIPLVEPLLRARAGRALFFDDPRAGQPFFGAYGASKAAQIALARSWQVEAASIGPQVLIEAPPPMPTALRARFFPGEDRSALSHPRDVARAILERVLRRVLD